MTSDLMENIYSIDVSMLGFNNKYYVSLITGYSSLHHPSFYSCVHLGSFFMFCLGKLNDTNYITENNRFLLFLFFFF